MQKIKVAVLGASGIGKYHAREYKNAGCEVAAILGSTDNSSKRTAEMLKNQFGISAKPYYNIDALLQNEKLDAVSICTPPKYHYGYVKKCLEAGLNVMCEKPFVLDNLTGNHNKALELINLASSRKKIITTNTQWVSALRFIPQEIFSKTISNFLIHMHPIGFRGIDLLTECLPHLNSILIQLAGIGDMENINFPIKSDNEVEVGFYYKTKSDGLCKASYHVKNKTEKPSDFGFSINGREFVRRIEDNYKQHLLNNGKIYPIDDPLKLSIQSFVKSIGSGEPLISKQEILKNVMMQDLIVEKYLSYDNNH